MTKTSSSFLIGNDLMLYFCFNSLDNGADNNALLSAEDEVKYAFLALERDDETSISS